jgi:putative glutamine amidotransferase
MKVCWKMGENTVMRPLIGVTTSELRSGSQTTLKRHSEPELPEMALGMTYLRAIERAGGMPVVLPPVGLDAADELISRLDGICLSGGPDLDPEAYGAPDRHAELGPTEPTLDAFELAIAQAADARGLPILGICRGAQALNVARGGTLHQHIDGHRQIESGSTTTHDVAVQARTRLSGLLRTREVGVNSFHHQAVDAPGDGLRVVGHAPDGTIEAIEERGRRFVLGVQWHAEALVDTREHLAIFTRLVVAAGGRTPLRLAA